jgi:uncharacterized protein (TIGR02145 family)/uncharacterized repeat protein (TIGR02543 family)
MSFQKTFLLSILLALWASSLSAIAPRNLHYQAVLRHPDGSAILLEQVNLVAQILKGNMDGQVIFSESHNIQTDSYGLISVEIGSIESLDIIQWGEDLYFLRIILNGDVMGVSQLMSVPMAMHALSSDDDFHGSYHDLINLPDLSGYITISGADTGDIAVYLNGQWQIIPAGQDGQYLLVVGGEPQWTDLSTGPETWPLNLVVDPPGSGYTQGSGNYPQNYTTTIVAIANEGYIFVQWTDESGTPLGTNYAIEFVMPAEQVTLTAHFEEHEEVPGTVTDIDGNVYPLITLAGREWMAENLRTTRYRDGSDIVTGLANSQWAATTEGATAVYPHTSVSGINSEEEMIHAYGRLYNWYATSDARGLCPAGWAVPTPEEWNQLGAAIFSGNELKSCRQVNSPLGGECNTQEHPRWNSHSTQYGTDVHGVAALPAGVRLTGGSYFGIGTIIYWWAKNEHSETNAWYRFLGHDNGSFHLNNGGKTFGMSVRCIKELP